MCGLTEKIDASHTQAFAELEVLGKKSSDSTVPQELCGHPLGWLSAFG